MPLCSSHLHFRFGFIFFARKISPNRFRKISTIECDVTGTVSNPANIERDYLVGWAHQPASQPCHHSFQTSRSHLVGMRLCVCAIAWWAHLEVITVNKHNFSTFNIDFRIRCRSMVAFSCGSLEKPSILMEMRIFQLDCCRFSVVQLLSGLLNTLHFLLLFRFLRIFPIAWIPCVIRLSCCFKSA